MNVVLLRMASLDDGPAVWHEAVLPNITTLKALSGTIQEAFSLGHEGAIEYEVLGCRAPGHRARLRDLVVSGITRLRYLQSGRRKCRVDIVLTPLSASPLDRSIAASKERPRGTAH